jgi:omega-amidase
MINDLTVTIVQFDIAWEQKEINLLYLDSKLKNIQAHSDIIILPEMFTTGFTMNTIALAESMDGDSVKWLIKTSGNLNSVITGSIIISENGKYYNRLICAFPDGKLFYYDKRHLFRMGNENEHFSSGTGKLVIDVNGWKIRPLICYDLRFPVWSRNINDYDLLVYVANWPAVRNQIWEKLLMARAIENLSYTIGVNRIGKDERDINYSGSSIIVDFKGNIIHSSKQGEEDIFTYKLSYNDLQDFRNKFPVHLDSDLFEIIS